MAEVALGIIVLYALITLLFTTLLFIAGRLQARSKMAIDRLSVIAEGLTEHTSATAQSIGSSAICDEFRTAFDRLTAELQQLRVRSADNAETALSSAEAPQACKAAIELLMTKIDHLLREGIGMPQQVAAELKAAIEALNTRIEQITSIVQRLPNPAEASSDETTSRRSVTFDAKTQQDVRDLLKEFE
jgi:BMFP domain-containing protein YqiC